MKDLEQSRADYRDQYDNLQQDKLTPEGAGHGKSLHITVECRGMIISRALIDNRSALNFFPFMTLSRIDMEDSMICPNGVMVQTFDSTKTSACGEVDLKILISPREFEVSFIIVDIPVVFNLILD